MRKFVGSALVVLLAVTFALADEFTMTITGLKGDKISGKKGGGKKGEPFEGTVAKDAKVVKGTLEKADKGVTVKGGDALEVNGKKGLDAVQALLDKAGEKGVFAGVVTNDKGVVTEIRVSEKGGKKKKKDTN